MLKCAASAWNPNLYQHFTLKVNRKFGCNDENCSHFKTIGRKENKIKRIMEAAASGLGLLWLTIHTCVCQSLTAGLLRQEDKTNQTWNRSKNKPKKYIDYAKTTSTPEIIPEP